VIQREDFPSNGAGLLVEALVRGALPGPTDRALRDLAGPTRGPPVRTLCALPADAPWAPYSFVTDVWYGRIKR
jgi:hypothetical protein